MAQEGEQFPKSFWRGRIGRMNFFLRWLVAGVVSEILWLIVVGAGMLLLVLAGNPTVIELVVNGQLEMLRLDVADAGLETTVLILCAIGVMLASPVYIFRLNAFIRRLHDRNHSGWWVILIILIPLVDLYFFFYLLFARGTPGDNKYGLRPRSFIPIDGERVKQAASVSKDALSGAASQLKRSATSSKEALGEATSRLKQSAGASKETLAEAADRLQKSASATKAKATLGGLANRLRRKRP